MVKQGYKQTEIGVIPEDWTVASVGDIAKDMADGPFGSNLKKVHYTIDKQARIVQLSNIGENGWEDENVKYTTFSHAKTISRCIVKPGQIIMAKMMPAGRAIICPKNEKMYVLGSDSIKIDIDDSVVNTKYFMYSTKSKMFQEQIKEDTQGSTRARTSISKLRKNIVVIPTICEQECIANALSDVDSMISSLEKLIAKKKAVKQGAMQELLTGKKRLLGFIGEWQEYTLSDLCYLITKQTGFDYTNEIKPSLVDVSSNYTLPFIQNKDFNGKNINLKTDYYIPNEIAIKYPRILLDETCMLISLSGRIGNVGLFEKSNGLAFIGGAVGICRFCDECNAEWCMLYLQSAAGQKQILECQKSGAQHNLTVEDVRKLVVKLPVSTEEQIAIASILSDMDNEIDTLEQKLAKARQLKQGMMQQLLTGKIRLIDDENVSASTVKHNDLTEVKTSHNHQFDDAVMIAAIVNAFYSEKYPLGRKKVQKLLYLLRRKQDADTSEFKKKAAGPYADEVRYKGGEPIAKRNGYIATSTTSKGTSFSKGKKIYAALNYVQKWEMESDFEWLVSQFRYTSVNDLELYATIDMAICDLQNEGIEVSVNTVKNLIGSNKEWKAKLKKNYFSDADIARAIAMSKKLFS